MEATSFTPRPTLPLRCSPAKSRSRRRLVPATRKTVIASVRRSGHDYGGRPVDENMIILRMRIREAKMLEGIHSPPENWMEWEKRYYAHYNEDVCEAVGLLHSFLMDTRPCLAFGMAALILLSVILSTSGLLFYAIHIAKQLLSN
ncbi:uncharacterized protein LOC132286332 isoform X2 [Cornus florida]|uniref:uncharacterized protein LOC132286332 isoform X2 n=1 Tax=Cornus florida TaxID=4283 RepID=UPI0028A2B908|nr:uncharacterized protein LOC132286332 isoform X2 [Cornus florida]